MNCCYVLCGPFSPSLIGMLIVNWMLGNDWLGKKSSIPVFHVIFFEWKKSCPTVQISIVPIYRVTYSFLIFFFLRSLHFPSMAETFELSIFSNFFHYYWFVYKSDVFKVIVSTRPGARVSSKSLIFAIIGFYRSTRFHITWIDREESNHWTTTI